MEKGREFKAPGMFEALWLLIERTLNRAASSENNPFYYLGAVCVFFLWIILVTGVYLFIFYTISAAGAYKSVESITKTQWYLGGVMRSLHRYASDGLIIGLLLHALRSFVLNRHRHWRWLAWVSGVVIAGVIVIGGVFGYWMVWDERAKLIATLSARMLENVPIFSLPLSINFARPENLTDQLFYIILFIHFSTIFFLFILILIHISRITKSVINPPKAVGYGVILLLLMLSFIKPAASAPPADLKVLAGEAPFDWFYMFIFPLLKFMSAKQVWLFLIAVSAIFAAVPWLSWRGRRNPAAAVTLSNCTGCELCLDDCPYMAIQIRPRTDGMPYKLEAVVLTNRCASCGLCAGACDYNAINLPDMTEDAVKEDIRRLSQEIASGGAEAPSVFVFACGRGAFAGMKTTGGKIEGFEGVRALVLPCIGMLQPSMLSIPFEKGVDGVFVTGCRTGDCHFRRGNDWFGGRLAGLRPPVVKKSLDRTRIRTAWLSYAEKEVILRSLREFRSDIAKRVSA